MESTGQSSLFIYQMRGQEFGKVYRKRDMITGILKYHKKDQSI